MSDRDRTVRCGLIQCSNPLNDESRPVAEIQAAMLEKHVPLIDEAGKRGVQYVFLILAITLSALIKIKKN